MKRAAETALPSTGSTGHDEADSHTKETGQGRRYKQPRLDVTAIAPGKAGVLVSCSRKREPKAAVDAMEMLNEKADELFPRPEESVQSQEGKPTNLTGNTDADTSSEADIAKEIQDEIAELESERKKDSVEPAMNLSKAARKRTFRQGRFAHLNFGVQAMTLIVCLDSNIDVVKVVDALCEKAKLEKQFPSRFVQRMVPIQKLVKSNIDNVMTAVKELVQGTNLASENPETVCVKFKSRFSNSLKRDETTKEIATYCLRDLENNKTDLKNGNTVIVVEVIKSLAGISVLDENRFHKHASYSLHVLAESEEETKKRKEQGQKSQRKPCESEGKATA